MTDQVDFSRAPHWAAEQARRQRGVENGGGPGDFDGMDRIARLETLMDVVRADVAALKTDVSAIRTDLTAIKVDAATLKERIAHLPTKGFIMQVVTAAAGLLAMVTVFGPNVRHLFGLS